jgi:hypothetical protein
MISESSIKDLLFKDLKNKNQGTREVNETFIQFKDYTNRIFNIYDEKEEPRNF